MRNLNFNMILGYSLSAVSAAAALIVLTGLLLPPGVPAEFRIMFGIVLSLLAVYRGLITWTQQKQARKENEEHSST